jgi:hypothetical protein
MGFHNSPIYCKIVYSFVIQHLSSADLIMQAAGFVGRVGAVAMVTLEICKIDAVDQGLQLCSRNSTRRSEKSRYLSEQSQARGKNLQADLWPEKLPESATSTLFASFETNSILAATFSIRVQRALTASSIANYMMSWNQNSGF